MTLRIAAMLTVTINSSSVKPRSAVFEEGRFELNEIMTAILEQNARGITIRAFRCAASLSSEFAPIRLAAPSGVAR
jgi:hypothetical protein